MGAQGACQDKSKLVNFVLLFGILLSLALCLVALSTIGKCYTDPCYIGDSVSSLLHVTHGMAFSAVTTALLTLLCNICTLYLLNKVGGPRRH